MGVRQVLEKHIEGKVVQYAKEHLGALVRKMDGLSFAHWPDRLFLLPGCPELWIEFKRPGKACTPGQLQLHKQLRAQGREVWVEDDAKLCIAKINAWYVMRHNDLPVGKPLGSPPFDIPGGVLVDRRTALCRHSRHAKCRRCVV